MLKKIYSLIQPYKKRISNRSIKFDLLLALIAVGILPIIILNVFYFIRMNNFIEDKVKLYQTELVKQVGQKLDYLLNQTDIAQTQLIEIIVNYELFHNNSDNKSIANIKQTEKLLESIKRSFSCISDLYLIQSNGSVFSSSIAYNKDKLLQKDWVTNINKEGFDMIIPTHTADYKNLFNLDSGMAI
ncbi:MAG: hypothetical protein MJE63_31915 [Proteobacteria bacterium]|nr:hypothetical protein [Pseudomonadota bacterium]